ncbi:MAG: dephospho-CoA kinase [Lachnospiraceae bacterium]|nr:dephospho-CoA kinase [Lachnospiraceae bacterium]
MKVIGITGGVGAGKSEVLKLIRSMCSCIIVTADDLAKELEQPGEVCYEPLVGLLGEKVLSPDGSIDKSEMAKIIFADGNEDILAGVNSIVHPAVKTRIRKMIGEAAARDDTDYFFIEAALLIEDHYDTIVDELWYVYADESVRRKRLKDTRGYTDSKIDDMMDSQSSDETFRKYAAVVIDNSGSLEATRHQLERIL